MVEAANTPVQVVSIDALIERAAQQYGLNEDHFYKTLSCESEGFKDVALQSEVPDPNGPNGRENSWGVGQLDLDYHPDITKAEAQDPTFAIPYAAKLYSDNPENFHCYKKEVAKGWK